MGGSEDRISDHIMCCYVVTKIRLENARPGIYDPHQPRSLYSSYTGARRRRSGQTDTWLNSDYVILNVTVFASGSRIQLLQGSACPAKLASYLLVSSVRIVSRREMEVCCLSVPFSHRNIFLVYYLIIPYSELQVPMF